MKHILQIEIDCGAETCASEPGKFCRFAGVQNFGTKHVCLLWRNADGGAHHLHDVGGWLARCKPCLEAQVGETAVMHAEEKWLSNERRIEHEIEAELERLGLGSPVDAGNCTTVLVVGAGADISVARRLMKLPHVEALEILRSSSDGRAAIKLLMECVTKHAEKVQGEVDGA